MFKLLQLPAFNEFMISKSEYDEFLLALGQYLIRGMQPYNALNLYIQTAEPTMFFKIKLQRIKREIENKGEFEFGALLLKEGIFRSNYEKKLFDTYDNKSKAISLIKDSREKNKSLTKELTTNYVYHILTALTFMSLFLLEDLWITVITSMHGFLDHESSAAAEVTKEFVKPFYWLPLETFIVSSIYFSFYTGLLISLHFGRIVRLYRAFFYANSYEETQVMLDALGFLRNYTAVGQTMHEALGDVLENIDTSLKDPFIRTRKSLSKGEKKFNKNIQRAGFSAPIVSAIKIIDMSDNTTSAIEEAMIVLEGRREKLRVNIVGAEKKFASLTFWVLTSIFQVLIGIEMYRAYLGININ